jgi:putative membrane protein
VIIEITLAIILGCLAGTLTGLAPGIHINLVSAFLVLSLDKFQSFPSISLASFIVAMSITHTFIDFIPSIFLGAPEEDNFLSILPGHQLLLEGRGHEAFLLTLKGSLLAIPIILILTPIFLAGLPSFYNIIKFLVPYILIFISIYIILRAEKIIQAIIVFILSGVLGLLTFNLPIEQPLLPLLSGLFGISTLIISLKSKTTLVPQVFYPLTKVKLTKREYLKSILSCSIASPLCSFLPGIGSGHAATLSSEITEQNPRTFLFSLGIINTVIMGLSYITVYSINKARTGTAAGVKDVLKTITQTDLTIVIITIIISGIIAFIIGLIASRFFAKNITKINYSKLTIIIITIVLIVNIIFTNWLGILVILTSSCLGIYTILSDTRRINLMACLILPSIIYYLLN